jgi:Uma2 family endonuclease
MNLASPDTGGYYSREAFRHWCDAQPKGRHERVDGRIVAMAPERGARLRVKGAIYRTLDRAVTLAGVPCQTLPDGATVETGDSDYEPDALVNCGEPMADDAIAAPHPVIINVAIRLTQGMHSCVEPVTSLPRNGRKTVHRR